MRFFIDYDHGDAIRGWIVPDNPLAPSRVAVSVEGRRVAEVRASLVDDNLRNLGLHATGLCTFVVGEAEVPGLAGLPGLELFEPDTNVAVYRRTPAEGRLQRRLVLVTTGIEPETALQAALFPYFQQCHFGLHRLSDEILTSVFTCFQASPAMPSAFLAGAILFPRYENYCPADEVLSAILVQDPYVELAARMLWLQGRAAEAADPARNWRLGRLAEAAAFAGGYDLADPRAIKRFFRMLPEPAYHLLYNPLTRQLGTRLPDDRLHPGHSIAAIEVLARIGIVGHRSRFRTFASTLLDRLGLDMPVPVLPDIPARTLELAERLRGVKAVDDMLIFDVAMSDAVRGSLAKGWDS